MKTVSAVLIVFAAFFFLAHSAPAKTFYLKNGEEIKYKSSWEKNGRIYVLINRDTLVDFAPQEVDLKKTYHRGMSKKKHKHHHVKHHKGVAKRHKPDIKPAGSVEKSPEKPAPISPAAGKTMTPPPPIKPPVAEKKNMPAAPVKNVPVTR